MDRIYPHPKPSVGVVVGTFAAVPYVHLHLESRRRFYPSVPLLVHDDGSPFREALAELCGRYGADFVCRGSRGRATVGDLSSYVSGFEWARRLDLDILVKFSRRFVPLYDWVPGLQALANESQLPTFSQACLHFNFGFRTECVAFHCDTWLCSGASQALRGHVDRDEPVFVEGFVHQLAREIVRDYACGAARAYLQDHPRPPDRDAYAPWDLMPDRRVARVPGLLWHDRDEPVDYCRAAAAFGLTYAVEDFNDPNQGCGLGEP